MTKVFGIGFHKTGTSSLGKALEKLGFTVCGARRDLVEPAVSGDLDALFKVLDEFDACQDNPWPILFKELDEHYPGSKFILIDRDPDEWLRSAIKHFADRDTEMRKWIYGVGHPLDNEEIYLERYNRHNTEVREYFKDRPDDLLIVDWAKGSGWKEICGFLGKEIPSEPFPHANKGRPAVRKVRKIRRKLGKKLRGQ
jgi:hypothetical protein